jgi:uncharacterized protein with PIN domain
MAFNVGMTCRIGRRPSDAFITRLHARPGSVRVVEIDGFNRRSFDFDQRRCPNCAISVRPIFAVDGDDSFEQEVYQCDDCMGMVRFVLKNQSMNVRRLETRQ